MDDPFLREHICCLCHQVFVGWGNNPAPLDSDTKKCCDDCNTLVVAERIRRFSADR
jgi:hypothetical protein